MSYCQSYLRPAIGSVIVLCLISIFTVFTSNGLITDSKMRPMSAHITSSRNEGGGENIGWQDVLAQDDTNSNYDYTEAKNLNKVNVVQKKGQTNIFSDKITPQSRVVFNRVGKCGSRTVLTLIRQLSKKNGFTLAASEINNETHIRLKDQVELVNIISAIEPPFIFQRHFHYIDFSRFGGIEPVYINIIRDPIDRFTSQYYFKRFGDETHTSFYKGSDLNMTINECVLSNHEECLEKKLFYITPFFCGQYEQCRSPIQWSLNKAINTFDEKFLLVGFIEELEDTLKMLELLLPNMFKGAAKIYHKPAATAVKISRTRTSHKVPPTDEVRAILQQRMQYEYEFYNYAKRRFNNLKHEMNII